MPVRKAGCPINAAFSFMVNTPGKRIITTQPSAARPNIMPRTPLIHPLPNFLKAGGASSSRRIFRRVSWRAFMP